MQKVVPSILLFCLMSMQLVYSQDFDPEASVTSTTPLRAANVATGSLGAALASGDFPDARPEFNSQMGYKRFVTPNLNINFLYYKFNVDFKDKVNAGFMSFDLNLEYNFFPDSEFTPFIYAGPGLNAANRFEQSGFKFQAGLGLEYLISKGLGFKITADHSFLSDDTLEGFEAGGDNDGYTRIGIGANIYFPLNVKRVKSDEESFIKANPIEN